MPDKRRSKRAADAAPAPAAIARYEAKVGLTNERTGRSYQPGEVVTADDFDQAVLEHWAETGRVVAL